MQMAAIVVGFVELWSSFLCLCSGCRDFSNDRGLPAGSASVFALSFGEEFAEI